MAGVKVFFYAVTKIGQILLFFLLLGGAIFAMSYIGILFAIIGAGILVWFLIWSCLQPDEESGADNDRD